MLNKVRGEGLLLTSSREYATVHDQVLAAAFIVCRFNLDTMFSELVGYLAFDS